MYLRELEGEGHVSLSWMGLVFDHYRCPMLFRLSKPVDRKSEEQSW